MSNSTSSPTLIPPARDCTQPLVDLLTELSDCQGELEAPELTVNAALAALKADFAALLAGGRLLCTGGPTMTPAAQEILFDAASRSLHHASLPGLGPVDVASAGVTGDSTSWLLVGRRHRAAFDAGQCSLLTGIARALDLQLRTLRSAEEEFELRRQSEKEAGQRKRAERELAHQALHDGLTGLPNRSLVRERTGHALERNRNGEGFVAALFVDIDHFKLANDSLDHRRGDKLLVLVSRRLANLLSLDENRRRGCTLARPGGDEFIVLCEDLETEHDAVTVAQQIHDVLRAPFFIDGQELALNASIGIACIRGADGAAADVLLRDADVALSRAKERGRDRYEIFDELMRVRLLDRVALESDLRGRPRAPGAGAPVPARGLAGRRQPGRR